MKAADDFLSYNITLYFLRLKWTRTTYKAILRRVTLSKKTPTLEDIVDLFDKYNVPDDVELDYDEIVRQARGDNPEDLALKQHELKLNGIYRSAKKRKVETTEMKGWSESDKKRVDEESQLVTRVHSLI